MTSQTRKFFYPHLDREIIFTAGVQYQDAFDDLAPYQSRAGKKLIVVKACLPDWEQIFRDLDASGISKEIHPRELIHELYEMAILVNPQLTIYST